MTKQFKNPSKKYLPRIINTQKPHIKTIKCAQSKCEAQSTWWDSFLSLQGWREATDGRVIRAHGFRGLRGRPVAPGPAGGAWSNQTCWLTAETWRRRGKRRKLEAPPSALGTSPQWLDDLLKGYTSQSSHYLQKVPSLEQVFNTGAVGDIGLPHKGTWYTLTKRKFNSYTVRPNVQFRDGWRSHFITMMYPLTRKTRGLQTCT